MARVEDGGVLVDETEEEIRKFFSRNDLIHVAALLVRPGIGQCLQQLEHTYYKPLTPRNDLFVMRVIEWCGLDWFVLSLPANEKSIMEEVGKQHGLWLSSSVPVMFRKGTSSTFPIIGENVFILVNGPERPTTQ